MSLDELFADLSKLPAQVQNLQSELAEIKSTLRNQTAARPTYDARQLQEELGYSKNEAYEILRSHGNKRHGRLRITADALLDYQNGVVRD